MSYDEALATRLRKAVGRRKGIVEKKMFGGLSFLLNGNMAVGVLGNELILRIDPAQNDKILKKSYARQFDFTGKPMIGWIYVGAVGLKSAADLKKWVQVGLEYAASLPAK